jgi:hypothetical protein
MSVMMDRQNRKLLYFENIDMDRVLKAAGCKYALGNMSFVIRSGAPAQYNALVIVNLVP